MYVKIPKTHLHTHHYELSSISFAEHNTFAYRQHTE